MKVFEVVGCCSSVARAQLAKASGPGFNSPVTTEIFHTLPLLFFSLDPFNLKKFNVISICFQTCRMCRRMTNKGIVQH